MNDPLIRCLVVDDDPLVREQFTAFIEAHKSLVLSGVCESAVEAADRLGRETFDLVFLDVEMPLMSGIELLRNLEHRPQVVMVTGKSEYAVEAFDIEVTDYLLKPVTFARFMKAVQRATRSQRAVPAALSTVDYVFIKSDGRLMKLELASVLLIEAQGDYVLIRTKDDQHLVYSTMKSMAAKLPESLFARVHRSYIVRVDRIEDIEDNSLVIARHVIPIGASYRTALLDRLRTL